MDPTFAIKFFGALLAIMNPLTALPVFLSLTEGATPEEQRATAVKVAVYVGVMGIVAALIGSQVLRLFGIDVHDLQVAGGLVVLSIAFSMLHGSESSAHHGSEKEKAATSSEDPVAFYPLTFPLVMGPGTLTTLILFAGQAKGVANWVGYFAAFAVVVGILAVVFSLGSRIGKRLSATARVIMSRLMGLILAAIAVEMIADGAKALLPGLAGSS